MSHSKHKFLLIALAIFFIFIGWLLYYSSPKSGDALGAPPAGNITIKGVVVCLPHRVGGEVQTLECTYGLKDSLDRYYALHDTDPMYKNIGSLPMNKLVEIVGKFTPKKDDKYKSIGVIDISSSSVIDNSKTGQ